MKVKSISDVITNSSTEVWVIREPLLEKAKRDLGDLWRDSRYYGEPRENLWDKFKIFSSPEDFTEDWRSRYIVPREILALMIPYRLPAHDRQLLLDWGHTGEEISAWEDEKTKAKQEELKNIDLSLYLGKAVAVFNDHFSRWGNCDEGRKLLGYLEAENPGKENWTYDW